MMSKLDNNAFLGRMQLLIEQFGEKKFSAYKQKLIYDIVKNLKEDQFKQVIDKIIGNFKYPPSVADISELSRPYRAENASRSICEVCSNSGFVTLYKITTGENIAFSCKCENAPQQTKVRGYWEVDKKQFTRLAPFRIDMTGKKDCYAEYKTDEYKSGVKHFAEHYKEILKNFTV